MHLALEEGQRMRKGDEFKNIIMIVAICMASSFLCMKCCLFICLINQAHEDYKKCISRTRLAINKIYFNISIRFQE